MDILGLTLPFGSQNNLRYEFLDAYWNGSVNGSNRSRNGDKSSCTGVSSSYLHQSAPSNLGEGTTLSIDNVTTSQSTSSPSLFSEVDQFINDQNKKIRGL